MTTKLAALEGSGGYWGTTSKSLSTGKRVCKSLAHEIHSQLSLRERWQTGEGFFRATWWLKLRNGSLFNVQQGPRARRLVSSRTFLTLVLLLVLILRWASLLWISFTVQGFTGKYHIFTFMQYRALRRNTSAFHVVRRFYRY